MAVVVPTEGESLILRFVINKTSQSDLVLGLFDNNFVPDEDSVLADLEEPTDASYSRITLTGSSWTISTVVVTKASYPEQTFTFNAAASVYGYFVTNGTGLIFLERFVDAPVILPVDGGEIKITLNFTAS